MRLLGAMPMTLRYSDLNPIGIEQSAASRAVLPSDEIYLLSCDAPRGNATHNSRALFSFA